MKTTNQIDREANERKAKELGEKYIEKFFSPNEYSIERCLLDMAQWKDEQEIEFLQSLMFQASTPKALNIIINNRIKLLKGE